MNDLSLSNRTTQPAGKGGLKAWVIAFTVMGITGGWSLLSFLIYYCWYHRGSKSETPDSTKEAFSPTPGEVLANIPDLALSELSRRRISELPNTNLSEILNCRERHELDNHALGIAP